MRLLSGRPFRLLEDGPARLFCRLRRDQSGISLVEMVVATALMAIVAAIFLPILFSVQTGVGRQADRNEVNDQLRLAVEQIDREIRSGGRLYDPALEAPPGYQNYVLRVYTQANAATRTPPNQCVRWRVKDDKLERQSYQVILGSASIISDWRIVAQPIVNKSVGVLAFVLDSNTRVINVTLVGNAGDAVTRRVQVQTSIAIRNAVAGDPCTPTPPWS